MNNKSAMQLLSAARDAAKKAYAPYSNFHVGAALWTDKGKLFVGCNVENASYGLTNCAERTAIFAAIAAGQRKFKALAIVSNGNQIPYPCGACRQVLAEFCAPDFPVLVASSGHLKSFEVLPLGELLPKSFHLK